MSLKQVIIAKFCRDEKLPHYSETGSIENGELRISGRYISTEKDFIAFISDAFEMWIRFKERKA